MQANANPSPIVEQARAKINLTLKVHGKRADGYHELESLVAFAEVADVVTFEPDRELNVSVAGPFGPSIAGENLIRVALEKLSRRAPQFQLGSVSLEKHLPIAAGVGGGSADAAAVLRAVRSSNPSLASKIDWMALAAEIGADVPVCLQNCAALMRGLGEQLVPLPNLPALDVVLVNPQVPVADNKTALVFKALGAKPLFVGWQARHAHTTFASRDLLIAYMASTGNDLLASALQIVPEVKTVMDALSATQGVEHVALSGGGPTCFAVYRNGTDAEAAAKSLLDKHPTWWVKATRVS